MSTLNDAITYARTLSQTDANGLTDDNGILFANDAQNNIIRTLVERGIDAANTQESYNNLTTDYPNTYAWPDDMFALKTIEVDFTGNGGQNFLQARMLDVANIQGVSWDYLRANQPITAPLFDNRGSTFEIFPIPPAPVTGGLRIFYFLQPTDFTSTADTIPYPLSLDYRAFSTRIAALYQMSLQDFPTAQELNADYDRRLNDVVKILAPSSQAPIQPQRLAISGWQF